MMLLAGADPDFQNEYRSDTALCAAAEYGHKTVALALIECGAGLHQLGSHHEAAIHAAARRSHVQIVRMLAEAGADVHLLSASSKTFRARFFETKRRYRALDLAIQRKEHSIVRILIEHNVYINPPLQMAMESRDDEIVRTLIKSKREFATADLDDDVWMMAFYEAGVSNADKALRTLVELKPGMIDLEDDVWSEALGLAAFGTPKALRTLVELEPAIADFKDDVWASALKHAAGNGNVEATRTLVKSKSGIIDIEDGFLGKRS